MSDKEQKYKRARIIYRFLSGVMFLSLLAAVIGLPVAFFDRPVGASLIAYGLVVAFVASSFYLISRTRYTKAKIALQAVQLAHRKNLQKDG